MSNGLTEPLRKSMEGYEKFKNPIIKILAVIGAVAILSLGGFLTITVLTKVPRILTNLTAQVVSITQNFIPAERIVLTLDNENPRDGDGVILTFEHLSKKEDGSYSFFYECKEGVRLEREVNSQNEIIFCNTPYNFVNSNNTISFRVFSTKSQLIDVPLSINFVKNNSDRISKRGKAVLRVNNDSVQEGGTILVVGNRGESTTRREAGEKIEETTLFNDSTEVISGTSDPNGMVDLRPKILEVGEIDRTTNEFTATSSIEFGKRGAVKFEIENIGTKASGSWTFNVVLPTFPAHIYHSKSQTPLLPGDRIEYTIGFDSIRSDGAPNTIVVNVDPISSIKESDETNNIVKIELPAFNL